MNELPESAAAGVQVATGTEVVVTVEQENASPPGQLATGVTEQVVCLHWLPALAASAVQEAANVGPVGTLKQLISLGTGVQVPDGVLCSVSTEYEKLCRVLLRVCTVALVDCKF